MFYLRPFALLICAGSLSYSATFDVYQDKSFYRYHPEGHFIGFAKGIEARCEDKPVRLERTLVCPDTQRLCGLYGERNDAEEKLMAVRFDKQALDTLITLPRPAAYDAKRAIETAHTIGAEKAALARQEKIRTVHFDLLSQKFAREVTADVPLALSRTCKSELTLSIPRGLISFDTRYEGEIKNKEITVTQSLSVSNRSGIDIEADQAMFHYRPARSYVNPVHFSPWIVSKYLPMPKRVYKKNMMRAAPEAMAMDMVAAVAAPTAASVSYNDAREYKVSGLKLLSTGEPLDLRLLQWKAPLQCELRAYPYQWREAMEVCTFKPKYQIEKNRWKIKEDGKVINENAIGEYRNGVYALYLRTDPDIQIRRHPIVKKERESGIFGTTVKKKDGFVLKITNKSDKSKTLKIVERIPTSTTDEIKVKLLDVKSDRKISYKLGREGKIEIPLHLKAHQNVKIEIWFEISYDKDLKVSY
jgi:hypothetical protein